MFPLARIRHSSRSTHMVRSLAGILSTIDEAVVTVRLICFSFKKGEGGETGIYEVDPRAYHVSQCEIMNGVDEPDLFVRARFDFMTIPIVKSGSVGEAGVLGIQHPQCH